MGPEYGKRTMVDVLEHEAKHHPDRPFACISRSNDLSDGFQYIGFQEIKNATDHVINLLRAEFETLEKHESICYIGVMDLRYNIVCFAAWKCRLQARRPFIDFSPKDLTCNRFSSLRLGIPLL